MIFIILWIIIAMVIGAVASGKKKSFFGYFLLSLFLTPLLALIILLVSSMPTATPSAPEAALPGPSADFREAWQHLRRHDPAIQQAADFLAQYGEEAVLHFRDIYEKVNNRDAIPSIVNQVVDKARSITDRAQWAPPHFKIVGNGGGIPVFRCANLFWAAGDFFHNAPDATAHAAQIARAEAAVTP